MIITCSFFSLFRQREEARENSLHAPSQKESQLFTLGCGTRCAQTSPRPTSCRVQSLHSLAASLAIATLSAPSQPPRRGGTFGL